MSEKYVTMLRGVNVGAHRRISMEELREVYEGLGLLNVRTYVQSGNVVFLSTKELADESTLARSIERAIRETFEMDDVGVLVRSRDELGNVIARCPFTERDVSKLHVTFLRDQPGEIPTLEIQRAWRGAEECSFRDREVYLFLPYGYGSTKLSNSFFEKKLRVPATTRNWRTTRKLFEMANS